MYLKSPDETHILVVEDDEEILELYGYYLEELGYKVDLAKNGEDAMKKAKKNSYDLAIIDYRLPGFNGNIVAAEISEKNPTTHILFITGSYDLVQKLLSKNSKYYVLLKPVKVEEIIKTIKKTLIDPELKFHPVDEYIVLE
jgi:DNA-binding response OmpR family regulator